MSAITQRAEAYLEKRADEFAGEVKKKTKSGKTLIIYGAGVIGKKLYGILKNRGVKIDAFCVTNMRNMAIHVCGLPVYSVGDIGKVRGDLFFLIGVKRAFRPEIIEMLHRHGFHEHMNLPDAISPMFDARFRRPLIQVTLKAGCGVNCHFCPQELFMKQYFSKQREPMMGLENFKTCLDKTPSNTVIEFAGFAEPFLNPEAAEMMLYTASTGREVNLFSTLVGMTKAIWGKIKKIPFTLVVLHLPDIKQYANILMTAEYLDLLREMMGAKKPNGKPFVDKVNSQSIIHPDVMKIVQGRTDIDTTQLIDRAGNLSSEDLQSGGIPHGALYCPTAAKLDHNILLPDGSLVLCCMDFGMQHVLGNLLTEPYEEIMQGDAMREIQRKMCVPDSSGLLCRKCVRARALDDEQQ